MTSYKIGDLVWAKMKGFPKWPGVVAEPSKELKSTKKANNYCIFFFGTNNFAWIEPKGLEPYSEPTDSKKKSGAFKDALAAIEHYKLTGEGGPPMEGETTDPFDQLIRPSASASTGLSAEKKMKNSSAKKRRISKDSQQEESQDESSSEDGPQRPAKMLKVKGPKKSTEITPKGRISRNSNSAQLVKRKKKAENYAADTTTGEAVVATTPSFRKPISINLHRADTPPLDLTSVSQTLVSKAVVPSDKIFGFIGLGIMGSGIVKNLLHAGHDVHIWDRSPEKSQEFARIGAKLEMTPSDVVGNADITFSCVSDPQAAKELVFGNCGVLLEMNSNKGFIEMSGIDPETSMTIGSAVQESGGRYLEAMQIGSKNEADEGSLTILAAGDRSLFNDASSCFEAMGHSSLFLGEVGNATKMSLIHHMFVGVTLASLAECMTLADRAGLNQSEVLHIFSVSDVCSPLLMEKGRAMVDCSFLTRFPLKHLQKDLKLAQGLSESLDQPIPVASAANEVFKHARRYGYGEHDVGAVYISSRF